MQQRENGITFEGNSFGAKGEAVGEIVFTTGMTGYLETLTDPSYYGQIVMQTFPLIGNYGVIPADFESSDVHIKGYIVNQWCQYPSNFRSEGDIDIFLKRHGVVGIWGIDTRHLTKIIRENGVMNGVISDKKPEGEVIEALKNYTVQNAVSAVTRTSTETFGEGKYRVALMDFGCKQNIIRRLAAHGCTVTAMPAYTSAEELAGFDGVMLSNGPGDPAENTEIIENLSRLCKMNVPIFGICLGHQLLALANGAKTEKLKYGHRGGNQPVRDTDRDRVYITSQNHGYAVVSGSLPQTAGYISHINANDGTCEGIKYTNIPAFSVQFHPEAAGGPQDTEYLFDEFVQLMEEVKSCR